MQLCHRLSSVHDNAKVNGSAFHHLFSPLQCLQSIEEAVIQNIIIIQLKNGLGLFLRKCGNVWKWDFTHRSSRLAS
jgi:hypothetical protein